MKNYLFVGDPKNYGNRKGLENGTIYSENYRPFRTTSKTVLDIIKRKQSVYHLFNDWQEIKTEQEIYSIVNEKLNTLTISDFQQWLKEKIK